MKLSSKILGIIIIGLLFGGIVVSDQWGLWQTESSKQAAVFSEGEFAGMADPADIRGSYTLDDVTKNFGIPVEILADAFNAPAENAGSLAIKELENLYESSPVEIGTASVRLFVALYNDLPYDLSKEETYLPQRAVEILETKTLTNERLDYLTSHTAAATQPENNAEVLTQPTSSPTAESTDRIVKGKTTFAEILGWGVSKETVEQVLGAPMPGDAQMTIKDHATAKGLDFETIKSSLQALADQTK